jgi:hypothetical protein
MVDRIDDRRDVGPALLAHVGAEGLARGVDDEHADLRPLLHDSSLGADDGATDVAEVVVLELAHVDDVRRQLTLRSRDRYRGRRRLVGGCGCPAAGGQT